MDCVKVVNTFSIMVVRGARASRTKDCVLDSSLSLAFSVAEVSVFMKASILGDLVVTTFGS